MNAISVKYGKDGIVLYGAAREEKFGVLFTDGFFLEKAENKDGEDVFTFLRGGVRLTVSYRYSDGALEEYARLENGGKEDYTPSSFVFGFLRRDPGPGLRFCAIPFRRRGEDGELMDWNTEEYLAKPHVFCTMRNPICNRRTTDTETAEGFALYGEDGHTLLVMKYAPRTIEWSLLRAEKDGLRFGGAGIGRMGDPEGGARLRPGERYSFGLTRYLLCEKGYKGAFALFRDYTVKQGHVPPEGYAPRLNWNELYDNRYWYESDGASHDVPALLDRYYHREDMLEAAKTAHEYGCRCLYLDPGWDTSFGSNLWDGERMGDMASFAEEIRERYGLTLGLHTPLAPWSDPSSYPESAKKTNADGQKEGILCVMSPSYAEAKLSRLRALCEAGADFFLFDGSWYETPCFDPSHGHSVPSTRQEHIEAINTLARRLHEAYPHAIIEQHDSIIGPGSPRYLPLTCMMKPGWGDPDEIWAFEFMNDPLEDFESGRAYSMYYANLSTALPFYLHIDLRYDNEECLSFWWFASTCRHLGIGGTSEGEKKEKQKRQVRRYLENEEFYTKGTFYGVDELIHAHRLGDRVLFDFFNPTKEEKDVTVTFPLSEIGFDTEEEYTLQVRVPAAGHASAAFDLGKE